MTMDSYARIELPKTLELTYEEDPLECEVGLQ